MSSDHTLDVLQAATGAVYHYTSAQGLLGILKEKALWASEAGSLNDLAEIRLGWERVTQWLKEHPSDSSEQLLHIVNDPADPFGDAFVLSASTAPDDVNQWRLYADGGRGYAIGIDASVPLGVVVEDQRPEKTRKPDLAHLFWASTDVTPWLHCIYDSPSIDAAMQQLIEAFETEIDRLQQTANTQEDWDVGRQVINAESYFRLATVASLIKSEGFSGENEVRKVVTPVARGAFQQFRASPIGVVSYVKLATAVWIGNEASNVLFTETDQYSVLPINSITAGPLVRTDSQRTHYALLEHYGLLGADVEFSAIKLR